MTDHIPLAQHTETSLDQLYADLDRAEFALARYAEAESADAAAGSYALRAEGVEARLAAVADLYERWVKAGAPTLGVSMARWWDARLVELHDSIRPAADESARTIPNNPDRAELETLRAKVAEADHIINWHTTCASCARILDSAYAETVRAEKAEATVARTRAYARTEQSLGNALASDDLLAVLDEAQTPAAPETVPNNSRTTVDNPATSSNWTPPPPGDRREQLPDAVLALLTDKAYLSTACDTAQQLEHAPAPIPTSGGAIPDVAWYMQMLHTRCRRNQKFTGQLCGCGCHQALAEPLAHVGGGANAEDCPACSGTNPPYPFICPGPDETAVDQDDEAVGAWTPDPPIGCLTITASPDFTSPLAGIEVRDPCPWCAGTPMIARTLLDEHVAQLHPEVQVLDGTGPEPTPSQRPDLHALLADAICAAACPGDCDQTEAECARQRIQPIVWHHGRLVSVEGSPEMFAGAVLTLLYQEWPWLRAEAEDAVPPA